MSERTPEQWQTDNTADPVQADDTQQDKGVRDDQRKAEDRQSKRHSRKGKTRGVAGLLGDYSTSGGEGQHQSSGEGYSADSSSREDTRGEYAQEEPVESADSDQEQNDTSGTGEVSHVRPDVAEHGVEAVSAQTEEEAMHQSPTEAIPETAGTQQDPAGATPGSASAESQSRESAGGQQSASTAESAGSEHGTSPGSTYEQTQTPHANSIDDHLSGGAWQSELQGAREAPTRSGPHARSGADLAESHTSAARPIPAGDRSPLARGSGERVVKVSYYVPEDHTFVLDEMRAQLKRRYRYTPRQASQSNLIALAIERLYEDLMGEPFNDDSEGP